MGLIAGAACELIWGFEIDLGMGGLVSVVFGGLATVTFLDAALSGSYSGTVCMALSGSAASTRSPDAVKTGPTSAVLFLWNIRSDPGIKASNRSAPGILLTAHPEVAVKTRTQANVVVSFRYVLFKTFLPLIYDWPAAFEFQ